MSKRGTRLKTYHLLEMHKVQLNLPTKATSGTEESGRDRYREVAVVQRFKKESKYEMSAQKSGRCGEVAITGGSAVLHLRACDKLIFLSKTSSSLDRIM